MAIPNEIRACNVGLSEGGKKGVEIANCVESLLE
jgi:hypothetical protein